MLQCSFPILDESIFALRNSRIPLHEYPFFKYMFEPQLAATNPTFTFIGYLRTVGPHLPPVELQARYATLVFTVCSVHCSVLCCFLVLVRSYS